MSKDTIFIVDDVPTNIKILSEALQDEFEILFATSSRKALDVISSNPPDLILLDVQMPEMDGYELCGLLKDDPRLHTIPVIFITAMSEEEDETRGFECGAVDYVRKPFKPMIVKSRVRTHVELKKHRDNLESLVQERTEELLNTQKEIVQRLGRAAEYRDNETGQHVQRLGHFCALLGAAVGMSVEEQDQFRLASTMHDVGKIGIPDDILLKPGKLNEEEWVIMRQHPHIGADLLAGSNCELLELARVIALNHHERWDGSGYPNGLRGEEIPLVGRIIAICDVFDALTSVRPYKQAWSVEETLSHLRKESGQHFDPTLVDLFEKLMPDILELKKRFED